MTARSPAWIPSGKRTFPMKMLDENILAPRRTIPGFPDEAGLQNTPALLVQATFIPGGLLLTVASHHAAMDMTGQGLLMSFLSKACHGELFAPQELMIGNLARHNLIPFLDDAYHPDPEASILHFKAQPSPKLTSTPSSPTEAELDMNNEKLNQAPPPCSWSHFTFRPSSLQALKFIATATKPSSTRFISTDDALCALIWQAISRARLARLSPTTESTLGRAIDLRPHIDTIPNTYLGLTQNMVLSNLTLESITTSTLGAISANLRSILTRGTSNILYNTSALATVVTRATNKTEAFAHEFLDYNKDIAISSWKEVNCSQLDFNLGLGFPEAVRRPSFTPLEGVVFFLPKALDEEVGVAICLQDEDMARLKGDGKFMKYATFVG
ncbi:transferase [Aspergillus multicolor]|uniref:transferase n=1 Tax=Aspergillus multicolor TaxID=41759 RepID=UPI003CCD5CB4